METVNLDTGSVLFMKELTQAQSRSDEEGGQLNGICPTALENDVSETPVNKLQRDPLSLDMSCPVGLHKGALLYPSPLLVYKKKWRKKTYAFFVFLMHVFFNLTDRNEVLQTAYSDRPLLPHLKDLTVPQVIVSIWQNNTSSLYWVYSVLLFSPPNCGAEVDALLTFL